MVIAKQEGFQKMIFLFKNLNNLKRNENAQNALINVFYLHKLLIQLTKYGFCKKLWKNESFYNWFFINS